MIVIKNRFIAKPDIIKKILHNIIDFQNVPPDTPVQLRFLSACLHT